MSTSPNSQIYKTQKLVNCNAKVVMTDYPFPRQMRPSGLLSPPDPEADDSSTSSSVEGAIRRRGSRRPMSMATKLLATFIALLVLLLFMLLVRPSKPAGAMSSIQVTSEDFFADFEGHADCGITSQSIYTSPNLHNERKPKHKVFCATRKLLLQALSGGGRHGFDAPYMPAECHYRWFTTNEICMILERFDAIVFIGDEMLKHVYAAFNILLRQNFALGALKQWKLEDAQINRCRCEAQFTSADCAEAINTDSNDVRENDARSKTTQSPLHCGRTPHMYLPISGSPASDDLHNRFTSLLKGDPDAYKPIPVVHSLGLSTSLSWPDATHSMDEWVSLADASLRNVPFLWMGPNAAGHLKPPTKILSEGNNALWHYTVEMAKEAQSRDLDAVGMYNMTLQASSWDGSNYGLKVALVQAMMVVNWLARVEST